MPSPKNTTKRHRKFIRKDSQREYASRSGMIEVGSTDGTSTYFTPGDLFYDDKPEKGKTVSTLRDKLKAKRQSEQSSIALPKSTLVTENDVAYRDKRAASHLANTRLACSICGINHTTFKYFLTRKSHFPICGDCLFNSNMNKVKGMNLHEAIQTLKQQSH